MPLPFLTSVPKSLGGLTKVVPLPAWKSRLPPPPATQRKPPLPSGTSWTVPPTLQPWPSGSLEPLTTTSAVPLILLLMTLPPGNVAWMATLQG